MALRLTKSINGVDFDHQKNKFLFDFNQYAPPWLNKNIFPSLIVFPLLW